MKPIKFFKNKYLLAAICIGSILLTTIAGCARTGATSTAQPSGTPSIAATNTSTVSSEGHLEPVTSTWLSFQTTGRVEEVLVKEGDTVTKDEPLVRLEGSDRAQAELTAAQSANFLAQQKLDDAKKSESAKAQAELALAEAQRKYNDALGNYWNRNDTQGTADQISLYEAKVILAQKKVDDLQHDYDGMGELLDTDPKKAQTLANLNQAKIDLKTVTDLRDYYRDLPDQLDVQTLTAQLDVAKANLDDAQRAYDRVKGGPNKDSLAEIQAAADQAQAAEDQAQWAFDQLVLKAPYDGTFVRCDLAKGQFVTIGQNAALVADFSTWKIKTDDLDETEVTQIDSSKPVTITADALPGKEFTGTVDSISQYSTNDNGDVLYTVTIKLANDEPELRWGMTMEVEFQK